MTDAQHTLRDMDGSKVKVFIRRDKRLKKTSRWQRQPDRSILLRVPAKLPNRFIQRQLAEIEVQLKKQKKVRVRRTDSELQKRAVMINKKYFNESLHWEAIRWVGNMNSRMGSCTNGGPTDGHIRISDKINHWPQWVVDYVIAHELVHRLYPNHGKAFWQTLTKGYPLTEQARGFIKGVGFAEGKDYSDE